MSGEGKSAMHSMTKGSIGSMPATGPADYWLTINWGDSDYCYQGMHTIWNIWNYFPAFEDSEIALLKGWTEKQRGITFNLLVRRGRGSGIDD
jgi:hypothetical protein